MSDEGEIGADSGWDAVGLQIENCKVQIANLGVQSIHTGGAASDEHSGVGLGSIGLVADAEEVVVEEADDVVAHFFGVLMGVESDGFRASVSIPRTVFRGGFFEGEATLFEVDATGDEVARISSEGVDMAAALTYGRSVGLPALRELTFHQRAALLKSLGQLLREHRQELYALSARTGATLGDAKFDVDGGIGVLLSYASRAKRELPNDTITSPTPLLPPKEESGIPFGV